MRALERDGELVLDGRLAIVQRLLPRYRAPFFDALAERVSGGVDVLAGEPRAAEGIATADGLERARLVRLRNRYLGPGRSFLYRSSGLARALEGLRPDALVLEANPRALGLGAAIAAARPRGVPVLGWGLGAPPAAGPGAAARRAWRARRARRFDAMIAYGSRGAAQYRALGLPPERVFVAPNAVAPRPTGEPPERPSDRFAEGRATILFVGRLIAAKRVEVLLDALALLGARNGSATPCLVVVGDGPEAPALRARAARIADAEVRFAGAVHGAQLTRQLERADLLVMPGTGGLALQEGMASALPVVVAEGDGTPDDLVREANGWRVAPGDATALAEAIATAIADPARLRAMGRVSFAIVRDEICLERMVDAYVEAIARSLELRERG